MKYTLIFLSILFSLTSCTSNRGYMVAHDIYILDKEDPIESLEDLTTRLKGKPIFIDRWATWCSPCIEEFMHSEALYNFLVDNNIEIVYLNSDSELDEEKLFEFIVDYNLRGNHVRLDSTLKADLVNKEIFIPIIPQYMIVDASGKVIENNALRPSNGEELFNQLKMKLNH